MTYPHKSASDDADLRAMKSRVEALSKALTCRCEIEPSGDRWFASARRADGSTVMERIDFEDEWFACDAVIEHLEDEGARVAPELVASIRAARRADEEVTAAVKAEAAARQSLDEAERRLQEQAGVFRQRVTALGAAILEADPSQVAIVQAMRGTAPTLLTGGATASAAAAAPAPNSAVWSETMGRAKAAHASMLKATAGMDRDDRFNAALLIAAQMAAAALSEAKFLAYARQMFGAARGALEDHVRERDAARAVAGDPEAPRA